MKERIVTIISISLVLFGSYLVLKHPGKHTSHQTEKPIISPNKIVTVDIKCVSFDGKEKTISMKVIDVISDDVIQIFNELKSIKFPIYAASCKTMRTKTDYGSISLHAYGAAIDVNYSMNPYYEITSKKIIPQRNQNREEDKQSIISELKKIDLSDEEMKEVVKVIVQPKGSDDWFLNREVNRKGMVTPEVIGIFRKYGFSEWGGHWRQPIDYMHFQMPRFVAEQLAKTDDFESRKEIWEEHKRDCQFYPEEWDDE